MLALHRCLAAFALGVVLSQAVAAPAAPSVLLDELTWTELRDAIKAGKTTIIVPVGGTEQSGPHIALGKHNVRVKVLAAKIAATLGNALVAPVPPGHRPGGLGRVAVSPGRCGQHFHRLHQAG